MTQKQEFKAEVGQVVQAAVFTQQIQTQGRSLITAERNELNAKVKELDKEYQEPSWKTWRFLHKTIGIEGINAMRLEHLESAKAILDLMLERSSLSKELKILKEEAPANVDVLSAVSEAKVIAAQTGLSLREHATHLQQVKSEISRLFNCLEKAETVIQNEK